MSTMRTFAVSVAVAFVASWGVALIMATGPRPICSEIYNAQPTDSCASIGAWSGVTEDQIKALNPDLHNCGPPMDVSSVCLRSWTPECFLWEPATETACDNLVAQWQISVDLFVELNDNIDDACDNLVIGQNYCVSDSPCYPGSNDPLCYQ